jgi:hypothetical protein
MQPTDQISTSKLILFAQDFECNVVGSSIQSPIQIKEDKTLEKLTNSEHKEVNLTFSFHHQNLTLLQGQSLQSSAPGLH